MAWELANEPRCASDPSGLVLGNWFDEMSRWIRGMDSSHLITTGMEGFYLQDNIKSWMNRQGTDIIRHHDFPFIDFVTVHSWPDHWGFEQNTEPALEMIRRQIYDVHSIIHKPILIEEFGKKRPVEQRNAYIRSVFEIIENTKAAGCLFWILYHDDYTDYDGFGVYYPRDTSTVELIKTFYQ
jgi:mannan endo-1,4-beta-mannosidase